MSKKYQINANFCVGEKEYAFLRNIAKKYSLKVSDVIKILVFDKILGEKSIIQEFN